MPVAEAGTVRGLVESPYPQNSTTALPLNQHAEQCLQSNGMPLMEANRQGQYFIARDPTKRACVVAIPTVTAVSSLYNGEPVGSNLVYVLKRISFVVNENTSAGSFGIVVNLQQLVATAGTDVKNIALPGGRATYPGNARVINGATAVAADNWVSVGNTSGSIIASAFGTTFDSGDLEGSFFIRPQRQLHAACVGYAVDLKGWIYFHWIERLIPNLVG